MPRKMTWTRQQEIVLLEDVNARGKKTTLSACKSLKRRDSDFARYSLKAMMVRYYRLRRKQLADEALDRELDDEEEEHKVRKPAKFTVLKMMASKTTGKLIPHTLGEAHVDEPPGREEIESLLVPIYGGGGYTVFNETTKRVHKRYMFEGQPKDPNARMAAHILDDDKRPLMRVMALLDRAKDNHEAWDNIFPRALAAVESVYKDIEAARVQLSKMEPVYKAKIKHDADRLEKEMEECDAALQREKLVDRETKQRD